MSFAKPAPTFSVKEDLTTPVEYRNGMWLLGFTWLVVVGAGIMAAILLGMAASCFFPLHGFTLGRAMNCFWWSLSGVSFAYMAKALADYAQRLRFSRVRLDVQGVDFQFGTKKNPQPIRLEWNEISAIQHKRVGNEHQFTVMGKDGRWATFSASTFFGAKKIAERIAAQANQSVQEG